MNKFGSGRINSKILIMIFSALMGSQTVEDPGEIN